jgi:hypothetical protein
LALDLDRSPRLETCIRSHIVRALVVGSGHKLDLHVGFFSKCCTLSIVAAVCSRPRPLDNNKTKSRRSSDAPFLPSAKGNSPQLKQRLQILFCSLPITQSGPLSPLHATDEPRASAPLVSRIFHRVSILLPGRDPWSSGEATLRAPKGRG